MIKHKNESLRYGFHFDYTDLQKATDKYEYFIEIQLHSGLIIDLFGCNDNYVYEEEYNKEIRTSDIYTCKLFNKKLDPICTWNIPSSPIKSYFDNTISLQKESTPLFYYGYLIAGFVSNYHEILKSIIKYSWDSINLSDEIKKFFPGEIKCGV